MPTIVTSQLTTRLFNEYEKTEITFTKDIIHILKMDPRQIYIKCGSSQWPCIINSTSFSLARIIIGNQGGAFQELAKKRDQPISLRFSFYQADGQLISFFISGKIQTIQPYGNSNDLVIVTITYTQRPPEDLILLVGSIIDANTNAVRRKNDRIVINPDTLRKLGIPRKEISVSIDNIPRNCILSDLSFDGTGIIVMGIAQFLKEKKVSLQLEFDEPHEVITLNGTITSASPIEGRKDIVLAHVTLAEGAVPLSYKIHINNFLTTYRRQDLGVRFEGDAPVEPTAAQPQASAQPQATAQQQAAQPASSAQPAQAASPAQAQGAQSQSAAPSAPAAQTQAAQGAAPSAQTAQSTASAQPQVPQTASSAQAQQADSTK